MSSVASKAAAFESSSASKFPLNRAAGSFIDKSTQGTEKPIFPKPSVLKAQHEGFHKEPKVLFPKPSVGVKHSLNTFSAQKEENEEKLPFAKFGLRSTAESENAHKESEALPIFPKPSTFAKPPNPGNSGDGKPAFSKNQFLKLNPQAGTGSTDRPLRPTFPKPTGTRPWNDHSGTTKESTETGKNEDGSIGKANAPFSLKPLKPMGEQAKPPAHRGEDRVGAASEGKGETPWSSALKSFPPKVKTEEGSVGSSKVSKLQSQFQGKAESQESKEGPKDPKAPKRKALPALWSLGPPPQKPARPPKVNLERFQTPQEKKQPPVPGLNRDAGKLQSALAPLIPNLPPRPVTNKPPDIIPTTEEEEEENYDDVQCVEQIPPPLPPMKPEDRRRQGVSNVGEEIDESGDAMYEDLDSYRSLKELKEQERKQEDKRRQELEKKEQKEKKREQDMRKKFKFSGPIEVIQTVKVTMDYKGGKNELSCKQGEYLEVIRITDNPEGKWLARAPDGSYGYIKVTCVDINYDDIRKKTLVKVKESPSLTQAMKQPVQNQELYDDVAPTNEIGIGTGGNSGHFPPPPGGEEIYDDVDEMSEDMKSIPPPESAAGEEVYDDIGTEDFPPPPPEFSLKLSTPNKGKRDEKDPKKLKKLEKEEKDFRKKFKYDGEIKILGTTQVAQNITNKKWGTRDLPVKAGEFLDIVQHTDDMKLLCRNEDGKFGYVQKVNLVTENAEGYGDIYDDIDTECIYDNE
ncbi:FYN-binding protein 1-like isoform X2 [Narcine bancroftii]|uniref:FYN-binding protein 1-like isoform X2 n=1 Tax=Narcine bancroftii TaxID=1343680 RepID=UPI0038319655